VKKIIEIENSIIIPFDWKDPTPGGQNLGVAEFVVCLKFRRGKISEFWVDPVQTRLEVIWHYTHGTSSGDFAISAYEGLQEKGAWFIGFCKTHKCPMIRVYAPNNARYLEINNYGLSFFRIMRKEREA